MDRIPPLREFLCSDSDTREMLRTAREIVLFGADPGAETLRSDLRRFGFRVRTMTDPDALATDPPIDILVWLRIPEDFGAALERARAARNRIAWLARGVGDPTHAWTAHRAGFDVVFHRDLAAEYRMHFDDVELGYVAPGSPRRDGDREAPG